MEQMILMQVTMFLLIFTGALIKKIGIIGPEGQKNITDLVVYVILPCNILTSFMVDFSVSMLINFGIIFIVSVLLQVFAVIIGYFTPKSLSPEETKCIRYGLICSNAGFLGSALAEGVYGATGLALSAVYLIPVRTMMWSAGVAVFTGNADKKKVIKQVCTHPCIIACVLGIILFLTGLRPPQFITMPIQYIGRGNTAFSMMVVGFCLADLNLKTLLEKKVLLYSLVRLIFIPLVAFIPCKLLGMDAVTMGVSVLLAGMPAGATTSILAYKYDVDPDFATQMVITSTLLSIITCAAWSFILM